MTLLGVLMQPDISIGCVANLFSRMMYFRNVGDTEQGHAHRHAHLTLLARGSLKVIVNDKETEFVAPYQIYIEKGIEHTLIATENDTIAFCIHALRDGDSTEDIIDPDSIPNGVSALSIALPTTENATGAPSIKPSNLRRKYFK